MGQGDDHRHPEGGPCLEDCCKEAIEEEAEQEGNRSDDDAAPPPQEGKDVSTVVKGLTNDVYDADNDHEVTPGADDYDGYKTRSEGDPDGGVVTSGAGVNVEAEDVKVKAANPANETEQLDGSSCAVKRRARRHFRRRRVVVL